MSTDIVHDIDLCHCFDCRCKRAEIRERAAKDKEDIVRAERDREAYIKRRGGEPHVPNRKP